MEVSRMFKQLFPITWIFIALITGILICLAAIAWMLLRPPAAEAQLHAGMEFVREVLRHAAA